MKPGLLPLMLTGTNYAVAAYRAPVRPEGKTVTRTGPVGAAVAVPASVRN